MRFTIPIVMLALLAGCSNLQARADRSQALNQGMSGLRDGLRSTVQSGLEGSVGHEVDPFTGDGHAWSRGVVFGGPASAKSIYPKYLAVARIRYRRHPPAKFWGEVELTHWSPRWAFFGNGYAADKNGRRFDVQKVDTSVDDAGREVLTEETVKVDVDPIEFIEAAKQGSGVELRLYGRPGSTVDVQIPKSAVMSLVVEAKSMTDAVDARAAKLQ